MTTGNWDSSVTVAQDHKTTLFKVWNGDDRPPSPAPVRTPYVTIHRGTAKYRVKMWVRGQKKRRAEVNAPHNYTCYGRNAYATFVARRIRPSGELILGFAGDFCTDRVFAKTGANYLVSQLDGNDQIRCVAKLRESIFGSDFNASVFLGESHQTLGLIADSAVRIANALRALKRGRLGTAAEYLVKGTGRHALAHRDFRVPARGEAWNRSMANHWLELQYGWIPLLKDTEGAAQSLAHALEVPFRKRYSATVRKELAEVKTLGGTGGGGNDSFSYIIHNVSSRRIVVSIEEKISVAAQLGLLNPENVAWELLPWSFVADWFIPIGSYLDARAVQSLTSGVCVTSTKMVSTLTNMLDTGSWPAYGGVWSNHGFAPSGGEQKTRDVYFTFDRVVSAAPAVPLPSFKGLAKAASWQHCANAIALLISQSKLR